MWVLGRRLLCTVMMALVCAGAVQAADKLTPASMFSDDAILQRDRPVPVWGQTRPGEEVTVQFAGQSKSVKADEAGNWKVQLDPLKASKEPAELVMQSGSDKIVAKNILVGEVWVASGQSNMEFTLGMLKIQRGVETPIGKEILEADYPLIRQFSVRKAKSPDKPRDMVEGKWIVCTPQNAPSFSGVGYFFARALFRKLDVPVALLYAPWSGMPIEPFISRPALEAVGAGKAFITSMEKQQAAFSPEKAEAEYQQLLVKWEADKKTAAAAGKPEPRKPNKPTAPNTSSSYPCTIFNAMIHPLIPYAIRGTIWYQGESNAGNAAGYAKLFPAMVQQWRADWGQGDFPFYYVQLANFLAVNTERDDKATWPALRESQRLALSLPNTGMAIIPDVGEVGDIHPRNKVVVGERLALWALAKDYAQADVKVWCGPLFKSAEFKDGKAVVTFDSVGSGLIAGTRADVWKDTVLAGEEPTRFQICGADKNWVWAAAKITGTDTVEVSAPEVKEPVAVRYAWMNNPGPVPLLYNKEGLPASPFTSEAIFGQ